MILTGKQIASFRDALVSAFHTPDKLKQMLTIQLDKSLDELVARKSLADMAYDLIQLAKAEGWTKRLLIGARAENPGNPALQAFEKSISISLFEMSKEDFEAKVRQDSTLHNTNDWIERLQSIEKQICRVETHNSYGTGFLVAPDVLLTNYHVVDDIINNPHLSKEVVLRFDYRKVGNNISQGETHTLAEEWLIAYSPVEPEGVLPTDEQCDYALLRLKSPLSSRNFVKLPALGASFSQNYQQNTLICIVQHPEGTPMKLAFGNVLGLNENQTRLHYDASTEGGSSGSPCFNVNNLELVALHHKGIEGVRNIGIPITKLVAHWEKQGLDTSTFKKKIDTAPINETFSSPKNMETNSTQESLSDFKARLKKILDDNGFDGVPEVLDAIDACSFDYIKHTFSTLRNNATAPLTALSPSNFITQLKVFISTLS